MSILLAVEHDLISALKFFWITIGGWIGQQHHLACRKSAAGDLLVLYHQSGHRDRCENAQELFDSSWHQGGFCDQPTAMLWRAREVQEGMAYRAPSRIDTGKQEKPQRAEQVLLGQRLSIDRLVHQKADEILPHVRTARLNLGSEEGIDLSDHSGKHDTVFNAVASKIVDPGAETIAVSLVNTQHARDHTRRHVARVISRSIALTGGDEGVDQL